MNTLSSPPCCNVEQKFCCTDVEAAYNRALELGALTAETMRQRDVYFHAPCARLKLRSIVSDRHGQTHELIAYARPDGAAERVCEYRVIPVAGPDEIEAALSSALGIRAIVSKRRRLLMSGSMRLHFDEVKDLGSFVEFEAVLGTGETEHAGREQIAQWRERLELNDPVSVSYVDLLEVQTVVRHW